MTSCTRVRSLLRRYREIVFVAALLAAPLLVFAVRGRQPARLNLIDRGVVQLTAPVEKLIVWVAGGLVDGAKGYVWLRRVREENLDLRRRLVRQEQDVIQSQEIKLENDRLRKVVGFRDRIGPGKPISAAVVAVGAAPDSHSLRIARGASDGITRGAPVVSSEGVVGTVARLGDSFADVQLITSPFSAVAALNQRTRARSTVKGMNDVERCKLEYARRTDDLQENDMLLTAGTEDGFPKGLRIGRVVDVQSKPYGLFQMAHVMPAVDFSRLDEVVVLVPPPPEAMPAAPPAHAPSQLPVARLPPAEAPLAVPAVARQPERTTP